MFAIGFVVTLTGFRTISFPVWDAAVFSLPKCAEEEEEEEEERKRQKKKKALGF